MNATIATEYLEQLLGWSMNLTARTIRKHINLVANLANMWDEHCHEALRLASRGAAQPFVLPICASIFQELGNRRNVAKYSPASFADISGALCMLNDTEQENLYDFDLGKGLVGNRVTKEAYYQHSRRVLFWLLLSNDFAAPISLDAVVEARQWVQYEPFIRLAHPRPTAAIDGQASVIHVEISTNDATLETKIFRRDGLLVGASLQHFETTCEPTYEMDLNELNMVDYEREYQQPNDNSLQNDNVESVHSENKIMYMEGMSNCEYDEII